MFEDSWYTIGMIGDLFSFCSNCIEDFFTGGNTCTCDVVFQSFPDDVIGLSIVFPSNTFLLTSDLTQGRIHEGMVIGLEADA